MFGISFSELLLVAVVALLVVGPKRLPKMLGTLGKWMGKARRVTSDMRQQSGIDEALRQEGLSGGLSELRGFVRGDLGSLAKAAGAATRQPPRPAPAPVRNDPYEGIASDELREYPPEGCDAGGALPDDLWTDTPTVDAEPPPAKGAAALESANQEPAVAAPAAPAGAPPDTPPQAVAEPSGVRPDSEEDEGTTEV